MKKLLAIFTLMLVNGCNFYAEQAIRGEKIIKANNPSVTFNMSISQGVKIKKEYIAIKKLNCVSGCFMDLSIVIQKLYF